jgi:prepilin-type N-terminal cleavage/methylation domain-containing protein
MRATSSPRTGMTMMELIIVMTISGLVAWAGTHMVGSSMRVYRTGTVAADLDTRLSRAMNRIAWELKGCSLGTIDPLATAPASTASITYQVATGFAGDVIVWGAPARLEFQLEVGELEDGLDNDGDELVDEGNLVLVQDSGLPGEHTTVLCSFVRRYLDGETLNGLDDNGNGLVDEPGLAFDAGAGTLTVRLSLERRTPEGTLLTRTSQTTLRPRNPQP